MSHMVPFFFCIVFFHAQSIDMTALLSTAELSFARVYLRYASFSNFILSSDNDGRKRGGGGGGGGRGL